MEDRIKSELIQSFKYFDGLREKLIYNPSREEQHSYMREWQLDHIDGIEENIEQRELSTMCEAARELKISIDDMNVWLCSHR